jgi:hypothetical protein
MSTSAQIRANQANAQKSTGPTSEQGKAASSRNNFRHGFRGKFNFLSNEDTDEFADMHAEFCQEHQPATITEQVLVQSLVEHRWLVLRARRLQGGILNANIHPDDLVKDMTLWMRYETQHERAFMKCLTELRNLREERRRAEIGSERQKEMQANNIRKQEAHEAKQRLTIAKTLAAEFDGERNKMTLKAPLTDQPESAMRTATPNVLAHKSAA